jgi:parallel beta-helix repeat protein
MRPIYFFLLLSLHCHVVWASCTLPADHQQSISITACGASIGSPDNQTFINAALTAAAGQYPGIYIPPGVYLTSGNHTPPEGVGILGAGTLKLTSVSTNPIVDISKANNIVSGVTFDLSGNSSASRVAVNIDGGSSNSTVTGTTAINGRIMAYVTNGGAAPVQVTIQNNVLNSPKVGGTSGGGINIDSGTTHFSVAGNRVFGSDGAGISVATSAEFGSITHNDTYSNAGSGIYVISGLYMVITDNNCSSNSQSGIGLNSAVSPRPGRISLIGNTCTNNLFDGMDINEATGTQYIYIEVVGNYLGSNGSPSTGGTGINIDNAANVTVSANTLFSNGTAGLLLNSSQNIAVTGNTFANSSQNGSSACLAAFGVAVCPGVLVYNSKFNSINGNISTNNGGTPSQSYGIQELGSSDYNAYTGNNTQNNVTGGITVLGAHDVQAGNL